MLELLSRAIQLVHIHLGRGDKITNCEISACHSGKKVSFQLLCPFHLSSPMTQQPPSFIHCNINVYIYTHRYVCVCVYIYAYILYIYLYIYRSKKQDLSGWQWNIWCFKIIVFSAYSLWSHLIYSDPWQSCRKPTENYLIIKVSIS